MKLKESWQQFSEAQVADFLRTGYEGVHHPSRIKVLNLLHGMGSVLDVGCGTGVTFELLQEQRPELDYVGIDTTDKFIKAAKMRYPQHAHRFHHGSLYELHKPNRRFDAVLCRHILEHLPDFIPAVQSMYERADYKLLIVFYLPPRPLFLRRKRDEKFEKGFYTHTYDLGAFMDHLLNGLAPSPIEVRIHPRVGTSDPTLPSGDRENIIYEVVRQR